MAKKYLPRVEKQAQYLASSLILQYGVKSALARVERLKHEYRHNPQWLARAIEILKEHVGDAELE